MKNEELKNQHPMKNIPDKVYLGITQDDLEEFNDFKLLRKEGEILWCEDKINDTDIEYVRLSKVEEMIKKAKERYADEE